MTKQRLTPWFPASVKPVHVGYYEVRNESYMHWNSKGRLVGRKSRYWNGKKWLTTDPKGHLGFISEPSIMGSHPSQQWRGLAEKPE